MTSPTAQICGTEVRYWRSMAIWPRLLAVRPERAVNIAMVDDMMEAIVPTITASSSNQR